MMEDTNKELFFSLGVTAMPTFRFYLEGTQVDETCGAAIAEVANKVRQTPLVSCISSPEVYLLFPSLSPPILNTSREEHVCVEHSRAHDPFVSRSRRCGGRIHIAQPLLGIR